MYRPTWERPNDAASYHKLAEFLIRNGNLRAAEGQLAEAVRLRPGFAAARADLARVRDVLAVQ